MIELTRLNGNSMTLNSDLIKTAEASPDTMLTLINGEKLIVRESCEEIVARILAWRARLLARVAQQIKNVGAFERTAAIASLDLERQCELSPDPVTGRAPADRLSIGRNDS